MTWGGGIKGHVKFRYGKLRQNVMYVDITTDLWSESISICWKPYYADGTEAPELTLTGSEIKAVSLFPQILLPFSDPEVQIDTVLDQFDRMGLGRSHDHHAADLL